MNVYDYFDGVGMAPFEAEDKQLKMMMPSYLKVDKKMCTFSPIALKKYSGYKHAAHFSMDYLMLVNSNGTQFKVPVTTKNDLDYIKIKIHHFNSPVKTKAEQFHFLPVINTT